MLKLLDGGQFKSLDQIQREVITEALDYYGGNAHVVARRLQIARSTLYRRVNELGIDLNAFRVEPVVFANPNPKAKH